MNIPVEALVFIKENPHLSVDAIASHLGVSVRMLRRDVSGCCGYTVQALKRNSRLEHASILLREARLSIKAIAFEAGWRSREQFSRVFAREYKMSPKEYQRQFSSQSSE